MKLFSSNSWPRSYAQDSCPPIPRFTCCKINQTLSCIHSSSESNDQDQIHLGNFLGSTEHFVSTTFSRLTLRSIYHVVSASCQILPSHSHLTKNTINFVQQMLLFLYFLGYLGLKEFHISSEKNKKPIRKGLDRGTLNTCANFQGLSLKNGVDIWAFVR